MINLKQEVTTLIKTLDPNLSETDPTFEGAVILFTSGLLDVTDEASLAGLLDIPVQNISVRAQRWRSAGVWGDHVINGTWIEHRDWDMKDVIQFWTHVNIGEGVIVRIRDDDEGDDLAYGLVR